ncbi:MAG: 1,4-dihydroxy-6-naphthoate synthase, partial [Bacteroidales bacterium]|nr:1,4-dihydroxy-6-naphthoate synthase [Bacteroidales bacterium]
QSVALALAHPEMPADFVSQHAQEMNPEVQRQHIALYVNKYSVNLDQHARLAIQHLVGTGGQNIDMEHIFVDID